VSGALLGQTTFATIGLLFLIAAIRTFTSSLYMTYFGKVSNETLGAIALSVFAASALALVAAWRLGQRSAIALSGTLLAGGTVLAAAVRWDWADIVLSGAALVGGTWWLALTHAARLRTGSSAFVLGLPLAIAGDLALRSAFRTIPVADLALPLALALTLAGALLFLAAGIASLDPEREWTSPGGRGALALFAIPALLLVGETAGTNPVQVLGAAGLGRGPEGPGSTYAGMVLIGAGMTAGALVLAQPGTRRVSAIVALALGSLLLWARVPIVSAAGGVLLAMGVIVAAAVLPDTAARPARAPIATALALTMGWILFVALAFAFYAYYAPPVAPLAAAAVVALGLVAAIPLPGARLGAGGAVLVGALAVVVPVAALFTTPGTTSETRPAFRLMTYNVHHGFDEANVAALDRIAEVITAESPDVVVLQEVVRGWMITEQHDVLTVLAERLGMSYVWGPTVGETWGNAVLSRLPISDVRTIAFPRETALRHVPRGAIFYRVSGVLIVATHLDHIDGATEVRQRQVRAILDAWRGEGPAILAGDLNALAGDREMKMLEEAGFRDLAAADGAVQPTFPAGAPERRIDYVWGIGVTGTQVHTVASTASDHRAVVVNIARRP
jgi:endonuclease/exonuclease/phosphatase family metal-dependent hydrolase